VCVCVTSNVQSTAYPLMAVLRSFIQHHNVKIKFICGQIKMQPGFV